MPDHWLLFALAASSLWAIGCVADVCLIGKRIYRQPSDGAVISGVFCIIPVILLLPRAGEVLPPPEAAAASAAAGVCYFLHVYFQFRAMHIMNDACNAEIFNTLSVLFVPALAFGLLGERLAPVHYAAIGLAFVGSLLLLSRQIARVRRRALCCLLASVLCASLAMVLQARSFVAASYAGGVLVFSLAVLAISAAVACSSAGRRRRFRELSSRYAWLFVGLGLLELGAVFASQRATDMAPSVSFVALAECALPIFIVLFSAAACGAIRLRAGASLRIRTALADQSSHLPAKLTSLGLIALAIVVVPL